MHCADSWMMNDNHIETVKPTAGALRTCRYGSKSWNLNIYAK